MIDECASLWEGRLCGDGYRKEFVPHTFTFKDGSCLTIAPEDKEVRFYSANSTRVNCTPKAIDEKHEDPLCECIKFCKKIQQRLPFGLPPWAQMSFCWMLVTLFFGAMRITIKLHLSQIQ